ncbi:PREDICTED: RNA polymerase II transcription factor B subunit 5-like [Camelina sativa]|uniref:General transcription and DNA repair factor IIH subunit TFB5 n=1 Tax=Camelina sativa TaxID=90675 RepID=A0ABM1R3N9_CAMSA|nr:PREDICTED: RNA polymerase II transcription factor B subunit 5-like [Camelina sativa]
MFFASRFSMVNSIKGVFISCDVPMAQFIAHLNNSLPPSQKFILQVLKLDTTCMFVKPQAEEMIHSAVIKFRDQNSYAKTN